MNQRWALFLFLTILPAAAPAQLPGGRPVDVDLQRAQFNEVMLKSAREAMQAFQEAWPAPAGGERLAKLYHDAATIVQPGGGLISGAPAIRAFADSLRGLARQATLALTDFEASEGIMYVYGPLFLEPLDARALSLEGQHVTVLKRESKGFRVRAQLLLPGQGDWTLRRQPPSHPSGPLTIQSMSQRPTAARYRSANYLLNQVQVAWRSDTTALFALFTPNALVRLPGQPAGVSGSKARQELSDILNSTGDLRLATLDYEGAGRMGVLIGQYYLELNGGGAATGYFALVLVGDGDDWKVRSLVFT